MLDGTHPVLLGPGQTFLQYEKGADQNITSQGFLGYYTTFQVSGVPRKTGPHVVTKPKPNSWPPVGFVASPPQVCYIHIGMPMLASSLNVDYTFVAKQTVNYARNDPVTGLPKIFTLPNVWNYGLYPAAKYGYALDDREYFLTSQNLIIHIGGVYHAIIGYLFCDSSYLVIGVPQNNGPILTLFDTRDATKPPIAEHWVDNPWYTERLRLLAIANEVRGVIQDANPGRTYVEVIDEFEAIGVGGADKTLDPAPFGGSQAYFNHDTDYHLLCPTADKVGYRPEFLHIFIGSSSQQENTLTPLGGWPFGDLTYNNFLLGQPWLADNSHGNLASTIVKQTGFLTDSAKFPKFGLRLFGNGVTGSPVPLSNVFANQTNTQVREQSVFISGDDGTYYVPWESNKTQFNPVKGWRTYNLSFLYNQTGSTQNLHTATSIGQTNIGIFNQSLTHWSKGGDANQYLQDSADYLSSRGADVEYVGESDGISSANDLSQIIAEYFGFEL